LAGITVNFFRDLLSDIMDINPVQRQSLLTFGSILALTGIGYISTFYFAHYLGPAILGSFFLFLAYYGIFDLIGDGGFGGAAVKRISEGNEQNEYFTAFFIMRIVLLGLSIVTFMVISPFLTVLENNGLLYWLIIALVAGTLASVTGINLYGTAQVGIMQVSNLFNTIVKNLVQILAVFIGFGLGGLVAGFIAGMIAATVINLRFIRLSLSHCDRSHFTGLLTFSIWTFLSSGGLLIFTYADTILIGLFMTEADVGIYRVAFQLTSVASFLVIAFHTVLFPRISKWHAEKQFNMIEYSLTRAFTYSLFLAIPVTAGGIILSGKLLYFLYGAAFETGAQVLMILLFVQIANIFMYLQTMCLNAMDKPRISFYITGVSAILNIVLNILLIPLFGISGAAIASLVTLSMNAVLAYGMLKSSVHIRIDTRSFLNLVVSALIMSGFLLVYLYVLPVRDFIGLGLTVTFSALIYFCAVLAIDRTIKNDLKELLETMHLPIIP
jgi:O-antigen/teichoic acid export membrane protein